MDQYSAVNRHYLDHVIALSETHGAEASEDIYAESGIKLLAKAARIDASTRERLLLHRLRKPIEDCLRLEQTVSGAQISREAEALLDQSSLLQQLYTGRRNSETARNLRELNLPPKLQTLNTMYAESQPGKLPHAVGASLLCSGLMDRLKPGDTTSQRIVLTAGLSHDIGELYLDPEHVATTEPQQPDDWRQLAAHPVIAHKLLSGMPALGNLVGETVLNHHERLDGFGYPRGLTGDQVSLHSQVLAVSEMLVGFIERSPAPLKQAHIAVRLVAGEFSKPITDLVASVCRGGELLEAQAVYPPLIDDALLQAAQIAGARDLLKHANDVLLGGDAGGASGAPAIGNPAAKALFQQVMLRLTRIQRSFYGTGIDAVPASELAQQLANIDDPDTQLEIVLTLQEVAWRIKELARETEARVSRVAPQEIPRARRLTELLLGTHAMV